MPAPVVLIPGTHDEDRAAWWRYDSPFASALRAHGHALVDGADPFIWSTDLNGTLWDDLWGRSHRDWHAAGHALLWYAHLKEPPHLLTGKIQPVSVIAFSHGGQAALYAAYYGLVVQTLITVATPVRRDMRMTASLARPNIAFWVNLFTDGTDLWQILGSRSFRRRMPLADQNLYEEGVGHRGLLDADLWTRNRWWDLLG